MTDYTSPADRAKMMRKQIKEALGLNARDVSVRCSRDGGFNVTVKSAKAAPHFGQIEEIANGFESVRRCEITRDILRGGNVFVFVNMGGEAEEMIKARATEIRGESEDTDRGQIFKNDRADVFGCENSGAYEYEVDMVAEDGARVRNRAHGLHFASEMAARFELFGSGSFDSHTGERFTWERERLQAEAAEAASEESETSKVVREAFEDVYGDDDETTIAKMITKGLEEIEAAEHMTDDEVDAHAIATADAIARTINEGPESGELTEWADINAACSEPTDRGIVDVDPARIIPFPVN